MSVDNIPGVDRGTRRGTHLDRLTDAFRPLSERVFDEDAQFVRNLESKLADARVDKTVQLYLTQALVLGILAGLLLGLLGLALGLLLSSAGLLQVETLTGFNIPSETISALIDVVRTPFLILSLALVLGAVGFTAAFGMYVARPYSLAGQRRREINTLLPDAVSFMYALSVGGMSQVEIIETMAESEETYGEVSREFRTILQETRYFDTDYRSAIRRRAAETPSTELSQFLTDMLSIIDSGGSMRDFLDDKKDIHFRAAREDQEQTLDTLELFSEVYITISLFPLLLIVILIILDMIGSGQNLLVYVTVYLLIPGLGIGFLVLVSTLLTDEPGDGYLELEESEQRFEVGRESGGALDLGLITRFTGTYAIFDRIARNEGTNRAISVVSQPHIFLRDNPLYTLAITAPAAFVFLVVAIVTGSVPVSLGGIIDRPLWATFIYAYVPLLTVCLPLAFFWEWNVRRRRAVLDGLSEHLRKLASANATGLTLLESIKVVAETTPGPVGEGFEDIYNKSHYGMHLKESLVVFNNKYRIPRLARTVKLISKAQEISSQIASVLSTAAKATETQEDIERKRRRHALMQVSIIIMTFLTLLGVMALLKSQFIEVMAEVTDQTGGGSVGGQAYGTTMSANLMSLLFFHAITLQAIVSGLACGYLRDGRVLSGIKYVVFLLVVSLGVWVVVA